jgi:hypothetical protein
MAPTIPLSKLRRPVLVERRQTGLALLMALIMMVIITVSALSMLLMMRSGSSAAANIAFREAAVRVADVGVESARTFIFSKDDSYRKKDHDTDGYYANEQPGFSAGAYDFYSCTNYFDLGTCSATNAREFGSIVSGYRVYYVIHRMASSSDLECSEAGANCMYPPNATSASGAVDGVSKSGGGGSPGITASGGRVLYRITIKVVGPRFNTRYIQAFVY